MNCCVEGRSPSPYPSPLPLPLPSHLSSIASPPVASQPVSSHEGAVSLDVEALSEHSPYTRTPQWHTASSENQTKQAVTRPCQGATPPDSLYSSMGPRRLYGRHQTAETVCIALPLGPDVAETHGHTQTAQLWRFGPECPDGVCLGDDGAGSPL